MKTLALFSLVGLAQLSLASFELLLVPDQGSSTVAPRIHRFDGSTGTYLGAFGTGRVTSFIYGICVDANRGVCYVADPNVGMTRWNYSTGEYLGIAASAPFSSSVLSIAPDGNVYAASGNTLHRFDPITNNITSVIVSGANNFQTVTFVSATEALAVDYSLTKYFRFSPKTGAIISSVNGTPLSDNYYEQSYFGRNTTGTPYIVRPAFGGGATDLYVDTFNGALTTVTTTQTTSTNVKNATGVAAAHAGYYMTGQLKSNPTVGTISYFNENRTEFNTFGSGQLIKPYGMASVFAPEPGTFLGIAAALGALALCRRKR